jgi:electron transfer flavoprotein beta subunit
MKAKKIDIPVMTADDINAAPESIGLKGSPTQVVEVFAPQPRGDRVTIEGTPDQMAEELIKKLTSAKVLSLGGGES